MLHQSLPVTTDPNIEGRVEHFENGVISGWMSVTGSDSPFMIEIVGPAGFYILSEAKLYRADLQHAGKANGLCAFSVITGLDHQYGISDFAVLPAGRPHRLRGPGEESISPIRFWLEIAQDPLAQDLIVHRCHLACTGTAAPPSLLTTARPAFPINSTSVCATMTHVLEHTQQRPRMDLQDQLTLTVQHVYRGLLRRDADLPTVERHRQALMSGRSLAELIEEVTAMPEFRQVRELSNTFPTDSAVPELNPPNDLIEKALLTLAIAATREKPPLIADSMLFPPAGQTAVPKRPALARGPIPADRTLPHSSPLSLEVSEERRRRST